ncbi:MAG: hypothetical protein LUC31_00420 [Coprobacillus sp.]|nr:hypothetical protein [Coprobacillus sp.]
MDKDVLTLKEHLESSHKTIALTGAGISYLYGVGRLKQQTSRAQLMQSLSPEFVNKHPDEFYQLMKNSFLDATFGLGPGEVHKQLVELEKRGHLQGIITNNMDCLHQIAGSTNVVEIQSGFDDSICINCGARFTDYHIWNQGCLPICPHCGGYIMPANFDRNSPTHDRDFAQRINQANDMLADAELVLIIGTTGFLSEQYMARMNPHAYVIQINPGSTKFDTMADLNIRKDAAIVFKQILDEE